MAEWAGAETEFCGFSKHVGRDWEDVVRDDRAYVEWIMDDDEHDFTIETHLYEHLMDLMEDPR